MSKKSKKKPMSSKRIKGKASNQKSRADTPAAQTSTSRHQIVDVLRGCAILLMFVYHFTYDLNYYGAVRINFNYDPFWLGFRTLIVSMFLGIMGFSLYSSKIRGFKKDRYFRRLGLLVLYAGIISLVTYLLFSEEMVFFGVLHFIAVATVIGLIFLRFYYLNLVIGAILILLGTNFGDTLFDKEALQWFGLMTFKPITIDYVPVLPWFGVVLIGQFAAQFGVSRRAFSNVLSWSSPHPIFRVLSFGGRHSLHIYMLHQPVFMGFLFIVFQAL